MPFCGQSVLGPSRRHHAQEVTHGKNKQGVSYANCCKQSRGSLHVYHNLTEFFLVAGGIQTSPSGIGLHLLLDASHSVPTSSENFGRSICSRGARRCSAERSWSASEQVQRLKSARRQPGQRERERVQGCFSTRLGGWRCVNSELSQFHNSTLLSAHMLMKRLREKNWAVLKQHVVSS